MAMPRMLSGRRGYRLKRPDPVIRSSSNEKKPKEKVKSKSELRKEVIAMLKYENELRMSEKWIKKMEVECNTIDSPLNGYSYAVQSPTIIELQTEVVKKFGYQSPSEIKLGLDRLRSALEEYNNDKEILNAANYLKFNRMRKGDFGIGDSVAGYDITLLKLDDGKKNNNGNDNVTDEKDEKDEKEEKEEKEGKKDDGNRFEAARVKFLDLLSKQRLNVVIGVSVT